MTEFKRGNLVKLTKDRMDYPKETEAVIEKSSTSCGYIQYSIRILHDGNGCAWYTEDELEFVNEGGEHLFKQANENKEKNETQQKDIKYILGRLDEGKLSTTSLLYLFDLIGHKSRFMTNGEFVTLYYEAMDMCPVFMHIKQSQTLEEAKDIFTDGGLEVYNVEAVFNAFRGVDNENI